MLRRGYVVNQIPQAKREIQKDALINQLLRAKREAKKEKPILKPHSIYGLLSMIGSFLKIYSVYNLYLFEINCFLTRGLVAC